MINKDEVKGKAKKIEGTIKDKAGEVIDDPNLEAEGELEQVEGEIQEGFGKVRRRIKETVNKNL